MKRTGRYNEDVPALEAEIAALRSALIDIGDFAQKTISDGEPIFDRIVLRDIIFRCADAIGNEQRVTGEGG